MYKLYNGCPNGELQAHWDSEDNAKDSIEHLGYRITYFPLEDGYYMCDAKTYSTVGPLFRSKSAALRWLKENK